MPLRIDREKCIGCGLCSAMCPRAFQMTAAGDVAEVTDKKARGADIDEAEGSCPTQAISQE